MAARVLKPPGGGSSDIFGASGEPSEPQRKTKTNHLTSSLSFGGEDNFTASRNRSGNDSFYNLFGTEPQYRPQSAVGDRLHSNRITEQSKLNVDDDTVKNSPNSSDSELNTQEPESNDVLTSHVTDSKTNSAETNGTHCDVSEDNSCFSRSSPDWTTPLPRPDVSPVTVEAVSVNGTATTNSTASTPAPVPPAASATASAAARQRVPPGGFSSGLW